MYSAGVNLLQVHSWRLRRESACQKDFAGMVLLSSLPCMRLYYHYLSRVENDTFETRECSNLLMMTNFLFTTKSHAFLYNLENDRRPLQTQLMPPKR